MKKTLTSCKRFILFYYLINVLLTLSFPIILFFGLRHGDAVPTILGPLSIVTSIFGLAFLITGLIGLRLYTYKIDNHEVICFDAFHSYMIVNEQIVDKAWNSSFHPPVLSHKMGNKHLEYSHRRLKVNGEYVMPGR